MLNAERKKRYAERTFVGAGSNNLEIRRHYSNEGGGTSIETQQNQKLLLRKNL